MTTKRRGIGEGSLYRRADGRWVATISAGWEADGRKRTHAYGKTRKEAEAKLRLLQDEAASGRPHVDGRTTVATFLADWLATVGPQLRPSTRLRYAGLVNGQIVPKLGHVRLAKLAPSDVARMLARLAEEGLAPRTIHHARAVLRAALADAERWEIVGRNVAALVEAPRVAHQAPRVLTPAEAQAVLEALSDPGLRRLATVAVHTGLRQGELLGLTWASIDWETKELHVTKALQRLGGEYRLVETKSRTSQRTVPLTDAALEELARERQAQRLAVIAAGAKWREPIKGLVFTSALGQPRNGSAILHQFGKALAVAGIPPMRWHDLRAAFGGLMLASGVDLATVSNLLGHSSIAITASTYAGVLPSLKREAAQRFERLLLTSPG